MRGSIPSRLNGVLVSIETGRTTAYALDGKQDRGTLFVGAGEQVYEGQIVGEHCRDNDLPVNVCRGEEADQHAGVRLRQDHHPQAAAPD